VLGGLLKIDESNSTDREQVAVQQPDAHEKPVNSVKSAG
jgi:hypothetical protein